MSVIDPRQWIDPVVTEEEHAILKEGKENRDHATLGAVTLAYILAENAGLGRLMVRRNDGGQAELTIQETLDKDISGSAARELQDLIDSLVPDSIDYPMAEFLARCRLAGISGSMNLTLEFEPR